MTDPQVQLSIVATVYCTGGYLAEFCSRSFAAALEAGYDPSRTEVVLVNDGCPRDGLEQALKEREKDGRVRVVDLSRNFGHHLAMYVACEEARGERVFLIDSDLEESPEWLEKRKGGLFEAVSGELFYTLFNLLSDQQITRNMVTARLMSARFLREMLKFQDREPFFFGLCVSAGFRQVPCRVKKASSSPTTYTFRKKMALAVNSVVSYSARPLVYISYFGLAVTLVAMLYVAWVVVRQLLYNVAPPGWASSVASIWLVGGLILMSLGVIGIYISKIYKETKHRPAVVVARRYE